MDSLNLGFKTNALHHDANQAVTMNDAASAENPVVLRVFVVENHPDTLKYLRMYLEMAGHTVIDARLMTEAIAALPSADCDVLISDIGLPDGDGWEMLRCVQEHLPRPVYAVAMSGFGMNADHQRSKEAGYRHHLLKPFKPSELDAMLEEAALELQVRR